jgi:hypothetical protein
MRKKEGERWRARGGPEAGWVAGERRWWTPVLEGHWQWRALGAN